MKLAILITNILILFFASTVFADNITINMTLLNGDAIGESIGTVVASEGSDGVSLKLNLNGLAPGAHGFHVHQHPSCGAAEKKGKQVAGLAAGGHYDPDKTDSHAGPIKKGHLGDLPKLVVNKDGQARQTVVAPRLKLRDLKGRSLMIHANGDNYADKPKPLGGGGARVACGVI